MRRHPRPIEDCVYRATAGTVGGVLFASAAIAADLARGHMALLATVCGASPEPHCGWCYGAAGLAMSGLAAFVAALNPQFRPLIASAKDA